MGKLFKKVKSYLRRIYKYDLDDGKLYKAWKSIEKDEKRRDIIEDVLKFVCQYKAEKMRKKLYEKIKESTKDEEILNWAKKIYKYSDLSMYRVMRGDWDKSDADDFGPEFFMTASERDEYGY